MQMFTPHPSNDHLPRTRGPALFIARRRCLPRRLLHCPSTSMIDIIIIISVGADAITLLLLGLLRLPFVVQA
jgi:hypothetical protein